jgi:S1-C subfamily serine protease
MVREFALRAKWEAGKLSESDLRVYPMPSRIGLEMDVNDGLSIRLVREDSPAAEAGLKSRDQLVKLNGQPLVSMADIQWVLHTAPEQTRLTATVRRGGELIEKTIVLSGDWKKSDIAWRASSWYGLRQGLKVDPLPAAERQSRGIEADTLALAVKGLFGKGKPKLEQSGLRVGDVIVAVDGRTQAMNESEFLTDLRLNHGPKDSVKLTILRGDARRELNVPMW